MLSNGALKALIGVGVLIVLGLSGLIISQMQPQEVNTPPIVKEEVAFMRVEAVGTSVEGRAIELYSLGQGSKELLFVGGIHGGYEWNSVALAYAFIDYFSEVPARIPAEVTVRIIPNLNPDGVYAVLGTEGRFSQADVPKGENTTGAGRFNANGVDLNRNFACKWQPKSTWRGKEVSAGTSAFSEPEAQALKRVVELYQPQSVVFWHSQSNAVYASECEEGVLPATTNLMNTYATAAGYRAIESFDAYPITGDAEGWLATLDIPAITVELATHESLDWEQNRKGVEALLHK